MFLRRFVVKLNINYKVSESFHWANRTLGFTLDTFSMIFTIISLIILLLFDNVNSGWIGLGITSLIKFQGDTQYLVIQMLFFDC